MRPASDVRLVLSGCLAKMPSKGHQLANRPSSDDRDGKAHSRKEAAKLLAPRFNSAGTNIDDMEWDSSDGAAYSSSVTTEDAKDVRAMPMAICKSNPKRAGGAIGRVLGKQSNVQVKDAALEAIGKLIDDDTEDRKKVIISGIRDSIRHHAIRGGTRPNAAENFVKNVACVFGAVKDDAEIGDQTIQNVTGINVHQLNIARAQVRALIDNNAMISAPPKRKTRKDWGVARWMRAADDDDLAKLGALAKPCSHEGCSYQAIQGGVCIGHGATAPPDIR